MTVNKNSIKAMKYDAKNTRIISVKINKNTEVAIYKKLESVENVNGYIKELIKKDIEK